MDTRALQGIVGVGLAIAIALGAMAFDASESRKHEAVRREEVRATLSSMRGRLELALNERVQLARGLEALALLRPDVSQEEFAAFASRLERDDAVVQGLQLARNGVISHVHPEADHRSVLGHSLLTDPRVADTARLALEERRMTVAGPYRLRQGTDSVVARMPVFRQAGASQEFWGFATVLIHFPSLLKHAGASGLPEGMLFAIRGRDGRGADGEVFHGDGRAFEAGALTADVRFPGGSWQMAARPVTGWSGSWPGREWLHIAAGVLMLSIPIVGAALRRAGLANEAAERLKLRDRLLSALREGVYGVDGEGRCTFVNPAALRMLGYSREELVGRDICAMICASPCGRCAEQGRVDEATLRRRDGTTFPARLSYDRLDGDAGAVTAFADVSEQKASAERLRLAASVFAHAQQGIMITDAAGQLVDVNPAFTEITGYAREEVLGKSPRVLSSGRQPPEFYAGMQRTLQETGHWRGEIWNRHKGGQVYPELLSIAAVPGENGAPGHFIGVFSDISRQKQHEAELARIAHYDPLTGLPNRVLMTDRLAQGLEGARRQRGRVALGMLDLDRFKEINDRHGHEVGDNVLVEVATRLKAAMRSCDTVARFGGDEFVLLLTGVAGVAACEAQAHRLIETLRAPFTVEGHRIELCASIGLTLFPDDSSDADTLLRHADQAMYLAKQQGGGRYRLFDPEQDRQARCHRQSLDRIARAIAEGEMRLFYQPKVDMRAGRVVGFEALARWQHPEEGLLAPASFLPIIASTELDIELGRWVLRQAIAQLAQWRAQGFDFALGMNVSACHLLAPGFLADLDAILAAHPAVSASSLEIEILETAAFDDLDAASATLRGCVERGARVAIDDFGTGYSSLAYFKHLPAHTLKIDQLFIRDMLSHPEDRAMVEGILRFARSFHREVIAEGVETGALCRALLEMGCHLAQGHGIAPPMPAERVPEWVRAFRPAPEWSLLARKIA